ncbi:MAG: hypothetical protein U1D35_09350, partial [Paracoccaceae bacterium]|nr:hypothetical protein [Paracoccaceae bacterium]
MAKYIPPVQGKISQIIDVIVLLVLAIGALYIPLWMGLAGSDKIANTQTAPTWESLGQNPTMVEKWTELGFADPAAAADIITARFDYSFTFGSLIAMIVVVVGYYVIMLRFSEK